MKKDEIRKTLSSIQESKTNAPLLVELVSALVESPDDVAGRMRAVHAVLQALRQVIRRGDFRRDESKAKYLTWLNQLYDETWQRLLSLISSPCEGEKRLKEKSLTTLMQLLVARHEDSQSITRRTRWTSEETQRLKSIVVKLCSCKAQQQPLLFVQRFREYFGYLDVKSAIITTLAKIVHAVKDDQNTKDFRSNVMHILEVLDFDAHATGGLPTLLCHSEEGESIYEFDKEEVRRHFSNLWLDFLKLNSGGADINIYKRILIILHDRVMPNLTRPLLLTDFLMESYNVGGSISLLALNGVFQLIQKHNLEYPDFYQKLYALFTPEVLHVKYRARFFHLANTFLLSTHLPEYLVAAFVKRLCRLSLISPANALVMIIHFVGNLFIRHPGLQKMLKHTQDPYVMEEPDPAKSKAIDSGVWEIAALQSHILPQVSQAAKFTSRPLPQMEWNVPLELENTFEEMMENESKKKVFVNVPLTFERPAGFKFAKLDLTANLFE